MYSINKGVYNQYSVLNSKVIVTGLLAVSLLGFGGHSSVHAKGGLPAGSSSVTNVPTSQGPCAYEWITDTGHVLYPLTHNTYPGVVSVDMLWGANEVPTVKNVCLDAGWTVESKQVTGGVQLRFSYNGVKAIDFKFVLGKTDIRNY